MTPARTFVLPSVLLLALLTGCAIGPDYEKPPVAAPDAFKETKGWKTAEPMDNIERGAWWAVYQDPILNALMKQVDISNQNLKQYEAAYREAMAVVGQTRSSLFPTVSLDGTGKRSGTGKRNAATAYDLSAGASWSLDLWGKLRRTTEGKEAAAEASAADLAGARLSAQASVASNYFALRVQDEKQRLLDKIVENDQKIFDLVTRNYQAGVSSQADLLSAQSALESARASAIAVGITRAQLEHAIAVLVGQSPADFDLPMTTAANRVPLIPASVPSTLLERRPDIAAAERQMAAANAQIGVAIGGYFPDLTLSASYGFAGSAIDNLIRTANSVWALGAESNLTLLDFGARGGAVDEARAAYDGNVAAYRQTVLTAFKSVEDNLVAQRVLIDQEKAQKTATDAARKAEQVTLNQYKEGIVAYNDVLSAQITRLTSEQALIAVQGDRLSASVALIEALGGGWDSHKLPN